MSKRSITFQVSDGEYQRIYDAAHRKRESMAAFCRTSVLNLLPQPKPAKNRKEASNG